MVAIVLSTGMLRPPRAITAGKGPCPPSGSLMVALKLIFFVPSDTSMTIEVLVRVALTTGLLGGRVPNSKACISLESSARLHCQSALVTTFSPL